jgi:hypothetical protein
MSRTETTALHSSSNHVVGSVSTPTVERVVGLELVLQRSREQLKRKYDPESGLALIQLGQK